MLHQNVDSQIRITKISKGSLTSLAMMIISKFWVFPATNLVDKNRVMKLLLMNL